MTGKRIFVECSDIEKTDEVNVERAEYGSGTDKIPVELREDLYVFTKQELIDMMLDYEDTVHLFEKEEEYIDDYIIENLRPCK